MRCLEAPGFIRGERHMSLSESPQYTGRAVVALLNDPSVINQSSKAHLVADLARAYEFTDIDGTQPVFTPDDDIRKP